MDLSRRRVSDRTRERLKNLRVAEKVEVRICMQCKLQSNMVDGSKKHPQQDRMVIARRRFELNKRDKAAIRELHEVESLYHHTSRCCGVKFRTALSDNIQPLWRRWLNRRNEIPYPLPYLRKSLGPHESEFDDDFVLMNCMLGLPDDKVHQIIRILRDEEQHQLAQIALEASAASAPPQPSPQPTAPQPAQEQPR